jgi:hypothetical protein
MMGMWTPTQDEIDTIIQRAATQLAERTVRVDWIPLPPDICFSAVLSASATDPTVVVVRDDDLRVAVNGTTVYVGHPGTVGLADVPGLGSVTNGDRMAVRATHNRYYGDFQQLSPLYLHCLDNQRMQALDATGYPTGSGRDFNEPGVDDAAWAFYDREFTVALERAPAVERHDTFEPHPRRDY